MSDRESLERRITAALTARGLRFETKRMMGGVTFMVEKKMCVGTVKQRLMVRFDTAHHEEVLTRPGAGPMDFAGKPMRGYVFVKMEAIETPAALDRWIDLALEFNPRAKRSRR